MSARGFLVLALAVGVTGCSDGSAVEVTGVVVDVVGDITSVESFTLLTTEGDTLELEVAPGVIFADGAPIGHLSEHLQSGQPVVLRYETAEDGALVVQEIDDA